MQQDKSNLEEKLPLLKTCSKEALIQLVERMKKILGNKHKDVENVYVVKNKKDEYMCSVFRTYKAARSSFNSDYIVESWPLSQWDIDDQEINQDKDILQKLVDMDRLNGKITADEVFKAIEVFGKTDNVEQCGWITLDGTMLHFDYQQLRLTGKSHAQIYRILDEYHKSAFRDLYKLDDNRLSSMNDSPVIDFCVQSGIIRCHVSKKHVYVQIEVVPTAEQKDVLQDIASFVKKSEGTTFNADVQSNGKFFQYDDKDVFALRFINDIFNSFNDE